MNRTLVIAVLGATALAGAGLTHTSSVSADGNPHVTGNVDITEANKSPVRDDAIPSVTVKPQDPQTIVVAEGDFRNGSCLIHVSTDGGATFVTGKRSPLPPQFERCSPNGAGKQFDMAWAQDGSLLFGFVATVGTDTANRGPANVVVSRTSNLGNDWENVVVRRNGPNAVPGGPSVAPATPESAPTEKPSPSPSPSPPASPSPSPAPSPSPSPSPSSSSSSTSSSSPSSSPSPSASPSPTAAPATTAPPPSKEGAVQVHLASDRKGHVVVGWAARNIKLPGLAVTESRAEVAVSDDDGKTFGAPIDIEGGTPDTLPARGGPSLGFAPDGSLYALFQQFAPPKEVTAAKDTPGVATYRSTDGGKTWQAQSVQPANQFTAFPDLGIAPLNGGKDYALVTVFEDQAPGDAGRLQVRDILSRRSTDNGKTWSEARRITDDPPANVASKFVPGISVAPNGRVDVAFQDFRDDNGRLLTNAYYTSSTDGGATWSANVKLSESPSDRHFGQFANYSDTRGPVGIASDNYAAYVVWDDTRNGSEAKPVSDVYFAAAQVAPLPVSSSFTALRVVGAIVGGLLAGGLLMVLVGLLVRRRRRRTSPAITGPEAT